MLPPALRLTEDRISVFWSRVDKTGGPEACWPWIAGRFPYGYGAFLVEERQMGAHVVSFILAYGPVPEGCVVRHVVCENPPCCNPAHLAAGTHQQNMDDAKLHDRFVKGEDNNGAKLTAPEVLAIRQRYVPFDPVHGAAAIARELGVNKQTISRIIRRVNWTHI